MPWISRHWRVLAVGLVIGLILAVGLWPETVAVDVVRVTRGALEVTIDEEGETRVRERFVVSAPVAGRVERIDLEPGDPVRKGSTVLARIAAAPAGLIDPRTQAELAAGTAAARAAIGLARAERDRAVASLGRAETSVRRQQELSEAGAISRDELEAAQTGLKVAQEAVRAAEFVVARAEYELQMAVARQRQPSNAGRPLDIVSPIDGVLMKRVHESEAVVQAGAPLVEVGDPQHMEVVADLLSMDAVRVPAGARVSIEPGRAAAPLRGRVRRVEPSGFMKVSALGVEEQRVNIRIDFVDQGGSRQSLGDGYRVDVRIVVWEQSDVLKVPVGCLFRRGDGWAVFIVQDGRTRVQPVTIGERNQSEAQITDGLQVDQALVLHPPDTLADGTRVQARGL